MYGAERHQESDLRYVPGFCVTKCVSRGAEPEAPRERHPAPLIESLLGRFYTLDLLVALV